MRRRAANRRLLTAAVSTGLHAGLVAALLLAPGPAAPPPEPEPIQVQLVTLPPPPPAPPAEVPRPPEPAPPKPPTKPPPKRVVARKAPPSPDVAPIFVDDRPSSDGEDELSDSEVASAATVGSGRGGGPCDMAGRLQAALRKDRRVQAATAEAHANASGKALLVWNGDWVKSRGQEGAGLAAVREAILWEVGFAPAACRKEAVRGLILLSLDDGPGSARVVLGSGAWRWSDLLSVRSRRRAFEPG